MGHAGAIISGSSGLAADKIKALNAVGVPVADIPSQIPALVAKRLASKAPAKKSAAKKVQKTAAKKTAKSVKGLKKAVRRK